MGQGAVTQTLKTQLLSGHMSHAYLFTGSRGTGKTSCAKILSKAVNCLNPHNGNPCNVCEACKAIDAGTCMDVLEIDAASNNGVDNVRDLRDDAVYAPSQVKKRVYIIDEVHMLSISAFSGSPSGGSPRRTSPHGCSMCPIRRASSWMTARHGCWRDWPTAVCATV